MMINMKKKEIIKIEQVEEKFPKGYVFTTTDEDLDDIKNFDNADR